MMIQEYEGQDIIKLSKDKLLILEFFASWCGPCKKLLPIVDQISVDYPIVQFIKIDVDQYSDFADEFDISSVPTLVFMKNGIVIDQLIGASQDSVLRNKIGLLLSH